MKDIKNFHPKKYDNGKYTFVEDGIYKLTYRGISVYYTSISFVQEPEFDEGENAADISEYPLEDLLEKFYCSISDFYQELNVESSQVCYQEVGSKDIEDIRNFRSIIGKHVYNVEDKDGCIGLVIE